MNVKESVVITLALLVLNNTITEEDANILISLADKRLSQYDHLPDSITETLEMLKVNL